MQQKINDFLQDDTEANKKTMSAFKQKQSINQMRTPFKKIKQRRKLNSNTMQLNQLKIPKKYSKNQKDIKNMSTK